MIDGGGNKREERKGEMKSAFKDNYAEEKKDYTIREEKMQCITLKDHSGIKINKIVQIRVGRKSTFSLHPQFDISNLNNTIIH